MTGGLAPAWIAVIVAAASAWGCAKATGPNSSSASNWLTCGNLADCASSPHAVVCEDGYCVDEGGERLRADRRSSVGTERSSVVEGDSEHLAARWTELPTPPLSGRVASLVASVGDRIVVAGGWACLCPPGADCAKPDTPPYSDGAAYDVNAGRWSPIADAPVGFREASTAVVGEDIYALIRCDSGPTCPAEGALLRYRSEADEWDLLPGPTESGYNRLLGSVDGVVAYNGSDESSSSPAYRFLANEDRWVALPDDPLPPVYDRFLVDPSTDAWSPLPDPPYHDLAGILGEDEATYEYADGWVLDARTDDWLEIEPRPDSSEVYDEVIAESPNRGLVVFGGQTWASGDGQLLNDVWLWTPPS